ncbi:MAG: hypothetical protein Kow0042_06610 [Calditrichia bacterium]
MEKCYHFSFAECFNVITLVLVAMFFLSVGSGFAQFPGPGNTLSFDGVDEYVSITQNSGLPIYNNGTNNAYTIEFWVKGDAQSDKTVFSESNTGTTQGERATVFDIGSGLGEADTTSKLEIYIRDATGALAVGDHTLISHAVVFDNTWHHVAWVDNDGDFAIYVDGVPDTSGSYTRASLTLNATSIAAIVSAAPPGIRAHFNGQIDELRIWNVARTQTQIRDNMCKKLTGNETNLVAYYRFDASSGSTLDDLTSNNNDGTLQNMESGDWVTSGAAIGDASAYLYTTDWSGQSVNLAHSDGDDITVNTVSGSPDGVHVYRVDETPNVTTPPSGYNKIDPLRYWGVYVVGGTSPTFTVVYNYDGHPGIGDENDLRLASRSDNTAASWSDLGITPNIGDNTLTATGQSGTEYILGTTTTDNPLPVSLASFEAHQVGNKVKIEWITYSEIENQGFELWRAVQTPDNFELISSYRDNPDLIGAGNSNTTHQYAYIDHNIQGEQTYYYQLWDVDYNGVKENHGIIQITVNAAELNVTADYLLHQNYPNPFNPNTYITFEIIEVNSPDSQTEPVSLEIYNLLGEKVRTLLNAPMGIGEYQVVWDGRDDAGNNLASGTYIYSLRVGKNKTSKKLLLVR